MAKTWTSKAVRGLIGAGALALMMAGQAGAAALTEPLHFDQRAGFLNPVVSSVIPVTFSNPTAPQTSNGTGGTFPANTFSDLAWGTAQTSNGQSKLNIKTFTDANSPSKGIIGLGDINGNGIWNAGEFWSITRLTQTNNVINEFSVPLWLINARANLTISDSGAFKVTDPNHDTPIEFNETKNETTCAQKTPFGTHCDDFYRVPLASLTTPVTIDLGDGDFLDLTFQIVPISGVIIQTVGPNLFAFTAENSPGISILDVQMRFELRHVGVPAPAALLLVGLGMTAIGALQLRRKNG